MTNKENNMVHKKRKRRVFIIVCIVLLSLLGGYGLLRIINVDYMEEQYLANLTEPEIKFKDSLDRIFDCKTFLSCEYDDYNKEMGDSNIAINTIRISFKDSSIYSDTLKLFQLAKQIIIPDYCKLPHKKNTNIVRVIYVRPNRNPYKNKSKLQMEEMVSKKKIAVFYRHYPIKCVS